MSDIFRTIDAPSQAQFREKMSRFISFALPVKTAEQAKAYIKQYQNEYHDSRHVCWAYMLGPQREEWQLSDNGEPSGTAGRPILGQINSFELTDILIIVVRYFGGIKLGTPGLIAAYRQAARMCIEEANIIEKFDTATLTVLFPYLAMNDVMKVLKRSEAEILNRTYEADCSIELSIRRDAIETLIQALTNIDNVKVE